MAVPESIRISKAKYKKNHETLAVDVPKGKRAAYRQVADELKMPLTKLVQKAVEEYAQTYASNVPDFAHIEDEFLTEREKLLVEREKLLAERENSLTEREKLLLERFKQLPDKTQQYFLRLMEDFIDPFTAQDDEEDDEEEEAAI